MSVRNFPMKTSRRTFVKTSTLLGGGLFLRAAAAAPTSAAETPAAPAANPTLETLRSLRTIHGNFADKPLPEPALQTILQASLRAANASNNQSYSIIVVKDRAAMKDICGYAGSCLLIYCADYTRMKASAESLGYTYEPGTMVDFVTAAINATLVAQTSVIAAKSLGIDSLLTNGIHRGDIERHWKLLELPPTHCFPIIALVLGYPTQEPAFQRGRLDGAGIVHAEKYHRLTNAEIDAITRRYDDKSQHVGSEDWYAKGHAHYLNWYLKEWVHAGRTITAETPLLRRLKRSGFVELQAG